MPPRLVADLGGTNCRFSLVDGDAFDQVEVLRVRDHASLADAAAAYLRKAVPPQAPIEAAICVACPVVGDEVKLTNHSWRFSISGLRDQLGLDRLAVINDFEAVAHSLPYLTDADRSQIGGGTPEPNKPLAVLGPGTGLGVSGLIWTGSGWVPLAGEGGHVTMPAADEEEAAVIEVQRKRHGHVSAERLLSGMGLVNLYEALAELSGETDPPAREAADITEAAMGHADPLCDKAVEMFCRMLGTVAGDLALSLGSFGGVYIAGGIVPKLGDRFLESGFRERFEAKGRFRKYLGTIPTYVVTHQLPAFLGLKAVLDQ